jgi:hypothetical protein
MMEVVIYQDVMLHRKVMLYGNVVVYLDVLICWSEMLPEKYHWKVRSGWTGDEGVDGLMEVARRWVG